MEDRKIVFVDDEGKETVCEIIFTYHSDDLNKDYIVFRDTVTGEVSAGAYIENAEGEGDIFPIESDAEWEMLEELLEEYAEEYPEA